MALRIFNRGVRDTKRELSEKFEKTVSRKGKKPSRMERDDKRALAGTVLYSIKRYSRMDAAKREAEYSATVDRLENAEKNFGGCRERRSALGHRRYTHKGCKCQCGRKTAF